MSCRTLLALLALVVAAALPPLLPSGEACCMVPAEYAGDVDQSAQEVVVLFHRGRQELILRVKPFFQEAEEAPASLAWLVTTPKVPTHYSVADKGIFLEARTLHERLEALYAEQRPEQAGSGAMRAGLDAPVTEAQGAWDEHLEVGPLVEVGPYAITPVTASGAEAVDALNAYLEEHGFGTEDPAHLAWFAEHEFTFLCIRITPPEGQATLGKRLELDPLRIAFETPRPYYPGMYSANQGNFGLELTLLSTTPIARRSLQAVREKLVGRTGEANLFTVQDLPAAIAGEEPDGLGAVDAERWYLNRIDSYGFNPKDAEGRPTVLGWKEDVRWSLGGDADLPPSWYYGDGEPPAPAVHAPAAMDMLLLALLFLGLLGAILVLWRAQRARRS